MEQKYQIEDPNYSKIFIDYENKKEPVKFEVVSDDSYFKLTLTALRGLWIFRGGFLLIAPTMITLLLVLGADSFIYPFLIIFWIFIPFLLAIPLSRNKSFIKLLPFINFDLFKKDHFFITFEPHQVENKQIEIPLFRNFGLDYRAEEEFSKYLKTFKIVPHPFSRMLDGKIKKNDKLWKAVWSFSEIPKNGKLLVRFE